jgi:hypothetical protein
MAATTEFGIIGKLTPEHVADVEQVVIGELRSNRVIPVPLQSKSS